MSWKITKPQIYDLNLSCDLAHPQVLANALLVNFIS